MQKVIAREAKKREAAEKKPAPLTAVVQPFCGLLTLRPSGERIASAACSGEMSPTSAIRFRTTLRRFFASASSFTGS
ncbi:hypothetical protein STENM223S_00800 [Streptomyces tendae]